MTFHFDPTLSDTVSVIRMHIGDTDPYKVAIQDEMIDALYALNGSDPNQLGVTVIQCLKYLQALVARPDFKADWLTITNKDAYARYGQQIRVKQAELGVQTSTTRRFYRYDS